MVFKNPCARSTSHPPVPFEWRSEYSICHFWTHHGYLVFIVEITFLGCSSLAIKGLTSIEREPCSRYLGPRIHSQQKTSVCERLECGSLEPRPSEPVGYYVEGFTVESPVLQGRLLRAQWAVSDNDTLGSWEWPSWEERPYWRAGSIVSTSPSLVCQRVLGGKSDRQRLGCRDGFFACYDESISILRTLL